MDVIQHICILICDTAGLQDYVIPIICLIMFTALVLSSGPHFLSTRSPDNNNNDVAFLFLSLIYTIKCLILGYVNLQIPI